MLIFGKRRNYGKHCRSKYAGITVTPEETARANQIIARIRNYYASKIVGQEQLGISLLVSMIANGHILLESVPGLLPRRPRQGS